MAWFDFYLYNHFSHIEVIYFLQLSLTMDVFFIYLYLFLYSFHGLEIMVLRLWNLRLVFAWNLRLVFALGWKQPVLLYLLAILYVSLFNSVSFCFILVMLGTS